MATQSTGLVTRTIPRVNGGVSQKAAIVRPPSKSQGLLNCWPLYNGGLKRRPGTNFRGTLDDTLSMTPEQDLFLHTYKRDASEKYAVIVADEQIAVLNLETGMAATVTTPDGVAYLASDSPSADFRAVTVGDVTFIVNKSVTVESDDAELSPEDVFEAMIWIRFADYATEYAIILENITYSVTTSATNREELRTPAIALALRMDIPHGEDIAYIDFGGQFATGDEYTISETVSGKTATLEASPFTAPEPFPEAPTKVGLVRQTIGNGFQDGIGGNLDEIPNIFCAGIGDRVRISTTDQTNRTFTASTASSTGSITATNSSVLANTYEFPSAQGSIFTLKRVDDADFAIQSADSMGSEALMVFKKEVQKFEDLPLIGVDGFRLKVTGGNITDADDYYVKFQGDEGAQKGVWVEDLKGGEEIALDASTMPHILVRNEDGTFTFQEATWTNRLVGDLDSNPFPSFVGKKIQDVFFYKNRLGFVAGENVCMSQVRDYFNFFRRTVTQILDEDRIDVTMSTPQASTIQWATPHDGGLLLWTELGQSLLTGEPILSPKTARIDDLTAFPVAPQVRPVRLGKNIYFATDRVNATSVSEYRTAETGELTNKDAIDISEEIDSYIKGSPVMMSATANGNLIAVRGSEETDTLYVCNQAWAGGDNAKQRKVHQAWSSWSFFGDILALSILDTEAVLIIKRGTEYVIEVANIVPPEKDVAPVALDVLFDAPTGVFATGNTTWTLAIDLPDGTHDGFDVDLIVVRKSTGEVLTTTRPANNSIRATGDFSAVPVWIGYTFKSMWDLSQIYIVEDVGNGEVIALTDGTLNLRYVELNYTDTGAFSVEVTPHPDTDRSYTYPYSGASQLTKGKLRFPVMAENVNASISVVGESWRPFAFQSMSWEGYLSDKTKRI